MLLLLMLLLHEKRNFTPGGLWLTGSDERPVGSECFESRRSLYGVSHLLRQGGPWGGGWLLPAPNGELPCNLWIGGPVRSTWGSIYQFQMFRNFETLIELASSRGPRIDPVHGIQ